MVDFTHDSMTRVWTLLFPIVNFPILILKYPAYDVFVSQLIRYARVCLKYEDSLFKRSILISVIEAGIFFTEI